MPPRRKSELNGAVVEPRRSRRVSTSVMSIDTVATAKKAKSTKAKSTKAPPTKKRSKAGSSRSGSMELDSEDEDGERRQKKPKLQKIIEGINSFSTLFEPLSAKGLEFDIPTLAPESELPRVVFVFGNGDSGQHGLGEAETGEIKKPRLQKWFEEKIGEGKEWAGGVSAIANGGMFTLAIDGEGKVYSWGVNDAGALGRDTSSDPDELEYSPHLVDGLVGEGLEAVQVAAGDSVGVAISKDGRLRAWGSFRNTEGVAAFAAGPGAPQIQLKPIPFDAFYNYSMVQIATGNDHFIALSSAGDVFACGRGEQNQLGRKIMSRHTNHGLTPEKLSLRKVVTIGSGAYHSFAVLQDGTVYGWGLNSFHQLGVEDDSETLGITEIPSLHPKKHNGAKVVQIVGGEHHTAFLMSNGEVYVCGRTDGYEMGLPKDHPQIVAAKERKDEALATRAIKREELVVKYTAEAELTADEIIAEANRVAANEIPLPNDFISTPTRLPFPASPDSPLETHKIIDISAATHNTFAVTAAGKLFAWGLGLSSQLGLGSEEEVEIPTLVTSVAMTGFRVIKAVAGGQHSTVLAVRGAGAKPTLLAPAPKVEKNGNGNEVEAEVFAEVAEEEKADEDDAMDTSTVAGGDVEMN